MNTFSQINIMLVWAVKYRLGLINPSWSEALYAVIGQKLKDLHCMPIQIGGYTDHVHVLFSLGANAPAIADIVRECKRSSSQWVNENRLTLGKFAWQRGGGRFSYSPSHIATVSHYIATQWEHHRYHTMHEELEKLYNGVAGSATQYDLPSPLE